MIYLTGDCHGDFHRFSRKQRMQLPFEMTADDFVMICGDMGLLWARDREFTYNRKWLCGGLCHIPLPVGESERKKRGGFMLAFYHYPFVQNQDFREYTEEELSHASKVEELFDYCQILEAYITKSGWDFLIRRYGYEGLYEIDRRSGWFDAVSLEEFEQCIAAQIECCMV